ncbi:MAG: hypothetical protein IJX08_02220 [Clostridia bacterium]|nr:hypothetical protein [Clostridia bacterium]
MEYTKRPDFRSGEDVEFCGAVRLYDGRHVKDQSEDFILPDYLPDIKKIASVFPGTAIKGRFLGSGTLEYEGEVSYRVLYVAEDHTLKSALFLTGFEDKIGGEEFGEDCVEVIAPLCENVSVRLLNPRKLNIRSSIGADVSVYKRRCHLPVLYGARTADDERALEPRIVYEDGANVMTLKESGLTLSEDISFEAAMPNGRELVFGRAVPSVQDCRTLEGEVQIRGVVDLFCLIEGESIVEGDKKEWIMLSRPISFSQTLKNEHLHEGGRCFVNLSPEGMEFRLREDEFGQKRVVEFDMTYLCDMTIFYEKPIAVCIDAYSLERETEKDAAQQTFCAPVAPLKGGFSVNESVQVDLPEEGGYRLMHVFAEPKMSASAEGKNGKVLLEGECALSLLLMDSAGNPDVRRSTLPLRFLTDIPVPQGSMHDDLSCKASGMRCRLDKNTLSCDMEIVFHGLLLSCREISAVQSIRILPEKRSKPGKRGSVILYYPEEGESFFEIAKKYGVTAAGLTAENTENADGPLVICCK